jgi:hypothetical protein
MSRSSSSLSNTQLQALVTNLTTRAPKTTFTVAGKPYLASKVVTLAQSVLTARGAISTAQGKLKNARNAGAEVEDEAIPIMSAVRGLLATMLSNDASALTDLMVAPRKAPTALTPKERLAATAKLRATRTARNTMSKKQKAKVKGNVTGIIVTPVTSQGSVVLSSASSANDNVAVPASASPPAPTLATANLAAASGATAAVTAPTTASGH